MANGRETLRKGAVVSLLVPSHRPSFFMPLQETERLMALVHWWPRLMTLTFLQGIIQLPFGIGITWLPLWYLGR